MPKRQVVIMRAPQLSLQRGTTLIEVLVTIIILAFGLLGLVGLQSRLQVSEMEAYQRSQALVLLEDMANRIAANRNSASEYVIGANAPVGAGDNCTVDTTAKRSTQDRCEWSRALQGAAELQGTSRVGALIGGRGCVETIASGEYLITVAWQGMGPLSAPPASVACGQNSYNGANGTACVNDRCRRVLTTVVRIAELAS